MLSALRAKPGIVSAEVIGLRDGDAYTFNIECEAGVDLRKSLFYMFAERNWPLIGMEALGMSLEDVFVAIVDQIAEKATRYERRSSREIAKKEQPRQSKMEQEIAKNITAKKTDEKSELSALFDDED